MVSIPQAIHPHSSPRPPQLGRVLTLSLCGLLVTGGVSLGLSQHWASRSQVSDPEPEVSLPTLSTLSALGHVEPMDQVIRLSVPSSSNSSRVEELLVEEGDWVEANQVIAILDNRDQLQAAFEQARGQLQIAEATLAQVQAGAKQGEILAQQATINRLEAEINNQIQAQQAAVDRLEAERNNAQADFQRYQDLFERGAISASERDRFALSLEAAEKQLLQAQADLNRLRSTERPQLEEARATLDRIQEVRPVDVRVAAAEVTAQRAAVQQAQAELDQAYLKAPQPGQIIEVHTYPGEISDSEGVVEIGRTDQMAVVAEVYESDIDHVEIGQPVRIYSDSFAEPMQGTVERIGLKVERQQVINTDPAENTDSRVVEVRIALESASSARVANLTNLQVTAEIQL